MLHAEIKKDMMAAWKAKDAITKDILTFLLSRIKNRAIELKVEELPDNEVLALIQKLIKELQDECHAYRDAGNKEKSEVIAKQIVIVTGYLPKQLTEEEIRAEIAKLEDKSMPSVMKHFKTNFAGKVDMSLVSKIARE